jgi:predicted transcriptional regulator
MNTSTGIRDRALALLGSGLGPEVTASALGVTTSAISQLLSETEFATAVAQIRFESLSRHNAQDAKYDDLEAKLTEKLENLLPMLQRPMEILRAITTINMAKRRGSGAQEHISGQHVVVTLNLPAITVNQFSTNNLNQVVKVGEQDLLTIQSGTLLGQTKAKLSAPKVTNKFEV